MSQPISVISLDGGRVEVNGVRFVGEGGEAMRDMRDPNHCYLVRHPAGLLLWDSGLSDRIHLLPGHTLEKGRFRFVVERPLASQLAALGVAPGDVDLAAYSHLQIDHAGNAGLFAHAETLLQEAELRMAFGRKAAAWGYVREDYAHLKGKGARVRKLNGDHDVFGDGRVRILAAPGHTPGHQVLYVELPSGPLLLSGDLYYAQGDPAEGIMPAWNWDAEQTRATMRRLEDFARERGARWVINHQPGALGTGTVGTGAVGTGTVE